MPNDDAGRAEKPKSALTRRLLVARGAAVAGIGAALPGAAVAQRTGVTDNDPADGPGSGRGAGGTRGGPTDNDPSDAAGSGRGPEPVSDNDPTDARGNGRPTAPATDNDPSDVPGRGRRR